MTQFIEFEDSKGDYNYYAADEIGKIIVEPADYVDGEAIAKVTIYDKKGRTVHTKIFDRTDDLCERHTAMNYCLSVTDTIKPVIPLHPGFSLLTSWGPLHESLEHKVPIVGIIPGQLSGDTKYVNILGNRYLAGGHRAVLNEATGEVFCTDTDDEDWTFESIDGWLVYVADHYGYRQWVVDHRERWAASANLTEAEIADACLAYFRKHGQLTNDLPDIMAFIDEEGPVDPARMAELRKNLGLPEAGQEISPDEEEEETEEAAREKVAAAKKKKVAAAA